LLKPCLESYRTCASATDQSATLVRVRVISVMRAAALPALIVDAVLQATPVHSLRALPPQSPLWQALYP